MGGGLGGGAAGGLGGLGAAAGAGAAAGPVGDPSDIICQLPAGTDSIGSLCFNPQGNFLAGGSWDQKVRLWEVQRGGSGGIAAAPLKAEQDFGAPVMDVCWRPEGAFIAGCQKTVKLWDLGKNALMDVAAHDAPVRYCFWLQDKGLLVTCSWDKSIRFWDLRSGSPAATVPAQNKISAMDVRGGVMVSCPMPVPGDTTHKIIVHDLRNLSAPFREIASPMKYLTRSIRLFHNGVQFAVGSVEGRCSVKHVDKTQDELVDGQGRAVNSFTFKCHRDDPKTGDRIYGISHIAAYPTEAFGSVFATCGSDGEYHFWDMKARSKLRSHKTP